MHLERRDLEIFEQLGILKDNERKLTLEPSEVPSLERWFLHTEVRGCWLWRGFAFGNCKGELLIWLESIGLRPIDGGMDLKADVEVLASQKVGSK